MTRYATSKSLGAVAIAAMFALALAASAGRAVAEDNQAPAAAQQQPPAPPIPQQSPPGNQPGFLHQLKGWWDDSITFFDQGIKDTRGKFEDLNKKSTDVTQGAAAAAQGALKGAGDATKGAAAAAQDAMKSAGAMTKDAAAVAEDAMKGAVAVSKDAATVIEKLPNTRLITLHELCEKAPNGAPDCETAAAKGCRSKGFAGGHPVDVRSAETCDLAALKAGKSPGHAECPVDTVVTRAICQ
jgi:hypothetical protein